MRWARARTMVEDSADHDLVYHAAFDHESTTEKGTPMDKSGARLVGTWERARPQSVCSAIY